MIQEVTSVWRENNTNITSKYIGNELDDCQSAIKHQKKKRNSDLDEFSEVLFHCKTSFLFIINDGRNFESIKPVALLNDSVLKRHMLMSPAAKTHCKCFIESIIY